MEIIVIITPDKSKLKKVIVPIMFFVFSDPHATYSDELASLKFEGLIFSS